MGTMASQITSLTIVYSTVYSGTDQRKHQSSASLAFVRGIHRWPVNSPHKGPVTRQMFPFDDVIMSLWRTPAEAIEQHWNPRVAMMPTFVVTSGTGDCHWNGNILFFLRSFRRYCLPVTKISSKWWHFRFSGGNWSKRSPSGEHYDDVLVSATASQITSLTIVYSTVYSDAVQRKH